MVKRALTLLTSILIALPLLMPFNIYANSEIQIVPTWSQSSQQNQWANKFRVTNYCESSNNPQNYSCQLTITVNGDYYGYVYFDAYINNQIIWDYQTMFISGGKGTFYYTWYANGLQQINKVNIAGLSLVSPTDNIDLSQIISILTSINNYEQSSNTHLDIIEDNTYNTVNEIKNVISQLIISNDYLETLTKLHNWNFPLESYYFNYYLLKNYDYYAVRNLDFYTYPIYHFSNGDNIFSLYIRNDLTAKCIFIFNRSINNQSQFDSFFSLTGCNYTFSSRFPSQSFSLTNERLSIVTIEMQGTNENAVLSYANNNSNIDFIGIYLARSDEFNYISTDFALKFGLSNRLLDDLDLIANGTTASQSAADSSQSANEQLETDSNTLFQQENGFKSDMNNAMQNVNTTFRLQDMGTKFVSSAQWVRSQYESLTNNTPFASLITFSLITGLALILLGKVYK